MRRHAGAAALAVVLLAPAACGGTGGPGNTAADGVLDLPPYNGVAATPPPDYPDPRELIGLSGEEITGKLGKPALIRREGSGEVWQYRRLQCVLDVFLYGAGNKVVEYVDLRDRGETTGPAVKACFQRMLEKPLDST